MLCSPSVVGSFLPRPFARSPTMAATGLSGSISRVYAHVNAQKTRDYYDYDNIAINWGCVTCSVRLIPMLTLFRSFSFALVMQRAGQL